MDPFLCERQVELTLDLPPPFSGYVSHRGGWNDLAGVSNLLASLGSTRRRVVLGPTLNVQTLMKIDKQKGKVVSNLRFCVGLHS